MKKQIKLWGTRTFSIVAIVLIAQHWGMPLYKQYFTHKKVAAYVPTTKVHEGKFVIGFHEIGTLDAEKSVSVTAQSNGRIISLIEDGKIVKAGDVLAVMDTTDVKREVRNAQLAYQNALADVTRSEAELEILKKSDETEVEQAQAQLDFDKVERDQSEKQLETKKRLAEDKLVPGDQVAQADLEFRAKKLTVTKGEMALTLKKKEVESKEQQKLADIAKVKFAAIISKSALDEVEIQAQQATITAPAGGLVVIAKTWTPEGQRKLQEGDSPHWRQTICMLPNLSSMLVKVQVGESDAPKIKVGVPTLIRLEAVPDKLYHGTVKDISRLATEANTWDSGGTPGRKNFEVTIAVKETDPKNINPGMTADVEFICETLKKAVYVPIECVTEENGKTHVFVKNGTRFQRVEVKTGKSNDNFICVTKGLRKDQLIALRDPTKPLDDQEAGSKNAAGQDKPKKQAVPVPDSTKEKK